MVCTVAKQGSQNESPWLLSGILAASIAPAYVKAGVLMPVRKLMEPVSIQSHGVRVFTFARPIHVVAGDSYLFCTGLVQDVVIVTQTGSINGWSMKNGVLVADYVN